MTAEHETGTDTITAPSGADVARALITERSEPALRFLRHRERIIVFLRQVAADEGDTCYRVRHGFQTPCTADRRRRWSSYCRFCQADAILREITTP